MNALNDLFQKLNAPTLEIYQMGDFMGSSLNMVTASHICVTLVIGWWAMTHVIAALKVSGIVHGLQYVKVCITV